MAKVIGGNKVKLDNGQLVDAQQGGWYDGQQFWGGSLSAPGVIHSQSNQQGAGQAVSNEVIAQTNPNNVAYIQQRQQQTGYTPQQISSAAGTSLPGGSGVGFSAPEALNLPQLYDQLYKTSGISDLEGQLSQREKEYIDATGTINDNPFLSEATRVGRVAKLDELYQKRTANLKNDIATKKADIETRLNLETKQFDINSQAAQQALDQFNTLLSMGALEGASGEDIANITRSTGLSSQAIMSAVNAQRQKNRQTAVQTFTADDGTVTAVVLDTQTGEIINQTSLGSIGNAQTGRGSATEIKAQEDQANRASLISDIRGRYTLKDLVNYYSAVLDVDEIYRLYNSYSPYGEAKEDIEDVKEGKFVS